MTYVRSLGTAFHNKCPTTIIFQTVWVRKEIIFSRESNYTSNFKILRYNNINVRCYLEWHFMFGKCTRNGGYKNSQSYVHATKEWKYKPNVLSIFGKAVLMLLKFSQILNQVDYYNNHTLIYIYYSKINTGQYSFCLT